MPITRVYYTWWIPSSSAAEDLDSQGSGTSHTPCAIGTQPGPALFERADRESWTLITTNAVVWETYTLIRIRARNGRELALGFLEDIQDGICDMERVRPVDETRAIDLLRRYADDMPSSSRAPRRNAN